MKNQLKIRTVAIDGPAGSGKTTVSKELAKKLGLSHLDTGAMYRAVAYAVIKNNINPEAADAVVELSKTLDIDVGSSGVFLNGEDITTEIRDKAITQAVSKVASHSGLRECLKKQQRDWVKKRGGGVVEGRDIGTVVLTSADLKIYLDANQDVRAQRRALESGLSTDEVLSSIKTRDTTDSTRQSAPLKKADNAILVDTSQKEVEVVVSEILSKARDLRKAKLLEDVELLKERGFIGRGIYSTIRITAYVIYKTYFRGKVYNRKKIPKVGSVILAPAGHRSNLDTPIIGAMSPRRLRYMAKDSLFLKSRFWSQFLALVGGFPVKRDRLDRKSMDIAANVLKEGAALVVFPEGSRQEGPKVKPLFGGVVWLSAKTGAPILPIGLAGGEKAMPIGRHLPRSKKIVVLIGDLIPAPEKRLSRKKMDAKSEELRQVLQELYDKAKLSIK